MTPVVVLMNEEKRVGTTKESVLAPSEEKARALVDLGLASWLDVERGKKQEQRRRGGKDSSGLWDCETCHLSFQILGAYHN